MKKLLFNAPLIECVLPESNIPMISESSLYSGYFNMIPRDDGVVRHHHAVLKYNHALYSPLFLMSVSAYLDSPVSIKLARYGVEEINIGSRNIPVDELGRLMVNYRWKSKTFPHISATDVLNNKIPADAFKDKIILVGVTALGVYDLRVTPIETNPPGIEIHANIIDNILSNDFLSKPGWTSACDIAAIVIGELFLGFILSFSGATIAAIVAAIMFSGHIFFCHLIFSNAGKIISMVYSLSVYLLIYIVIVGYKYFAEEGQKRFIRNAFSTYLAPSVVKQIIESPEKLVLGGQQKDITAFFSDVQGFTSISEKLTPSDLVELLNEFLTEITDIILKYEGTVHKFEGDAIIAFFGVLNDLGNHADVACRASIDMQKRLVGLRGKWKDEGKAELKMRIGLSSEPAVVGNMGSTSRMDYTMMGDTVNTAARLEDINKKYRIYNLIVENVFKALNDDIVTSGIDTIHVVGRKEPITIYQLIGYRDEIDDKTIDIITLYEKGLKEYRLKEWDKAIRLFITLVRLDLEDGLNRVMIELCENYKKEPPDKDWDGFFAMVSK